ncbi:HNH endonuclease signature motif containing protein [Nocardioides campestrisoli]|uniref:HNH endonuclease signature motif containing protein n=1 Tax=Nocardioides campestrisoli TaxID=2736757 RepID=UPI0015E6E496|nr:HNH endonuclease signature motif containing protein [Nocardioides campestrisoli]
MWQQAGSEHPITQAVALISGALDLAKGADPDYLSERAQREAMLELSRLGDRMESLRMRVIRAAGVPAGATEADGARSAAEWLASRTRSGFGPARAAERLAGAVAERWLRVGAGLADGSVNLAQARVIVRALDALVTDPLPGEEVPAEVLDRAEARLVADGATFGPALLAALGAKILQVVAPETYDEHERKLLERAERRAHAATRLTLHRRGDGSTEVKGRIPDHVAARFRTFLDSWTSPKQDDGKATGAATGLGAFGHRDPSTGERLPQDRLHGLAFCAFLEAADPARMPVHGGSATRVLVTIGLEELRTGLGTGSILSNGDDVTTISAAQARRMACQAQVVPAVLGSDSVPLDLGRATRFFTVQQRDAKTLTQHTCGAEGCSIPSTWCEAHHARDPWAAGGGSDLADLEFLCSWHHHRAHDPGYTTTRMPNGDVRFRRRR